MSKTYGHLVKARWTGCQFPRDTAPNPKWTPCQLVPDTASNTKSVAFPTISVERGQYCWPSCSTFPPISWTCFNQEYRTNNDLEGTSNNRRLNALAKDMGLVLQYCMGFNQNNTWRGPEITTYCGVIVRGLSAEKKMGRTGGENTFLVGPIHC